MFKVPFQDFVMIEKRVPPYRNVPLEDKTKRPHVFAFSHSVSRE
jgi:hypothetical protein